MNKTVSITFGAKDHGMFAGSDSNIVIAYGKGEAEGQLLATKYDSNGHVVQKMILGVGCVITCQEVQSKSSENYKVTWKHFLVTFEERDSETRKSTVREVVYEAKGMAFAKEKFERDFYRNVTLLSIKELSDIPEEAVQA